MKKIIFLFSLAMLVSCKSNNEEEIWLKSIFNCNNSSKYCFYLDKEEQVCTKRFMTFLSESEQIYGASNFTSEERKKAEIEYLKKWKNIYPPNKKANWLFGRGQDDTEEIIAVKINKISNLKYSVFIDYGNGIKTQNEVTLISQDGSYKIDYCDTKFN